MALKWMSKPLNTMSNGRRFVSVRTSCNWHSCKMINIVYSFGFSFLSSIPQIFERINRVLFFIATQYVIFVQFSWINWKTNKEKKKKRKLGSIPNNQLWIEHGHVIKMVKLDKLHHFHSSRYDAFHSSNTACLSLYACGVHVSMWQLTKFMQENYCSEIYYIYIYICVLTETKEMRYLNVAYQIGAFFLHLLWNDIAEAQYDSITLRLRCCRHFKRHTAVKHQLKMVSKILLPL